MYPLLVSAEFDNFLNDLAESLEIPPSRYEEAEKRYKSVGEWLRRDNSTLNKADPKVYIQGSFALGTVIQPVSDDEDYDIDLVCELSYTKTELTQEKLKACLGQEIRAYANAHRMAPPESARRCWTLGYAEGAQFHLDALPAIPDGHDRRVLLEKLGVDPAWVGVAIAITDDQHSDYKRLSKSWPHSNPKGYAQWFRSRMRVIYDERRMRVALREALASVEDVPDYKIKTPLQAVVQILKRHRDMMFVHDPDNRPISIIVTTLAARSYQQEADIAAALKNILSNMGSHIEYRNGVAWIPNPTDPMENFADKWREHPERARAFYRWLEQAGADFKAAEQVADRDGIASALEPRLGRRLVESALSRRSSGGVVSRAKSALRAVGAKAAQFLSVRHRQPPPWSIYERGTVMISSARAQRSGFRPVEFGSDGPPLPKHSSLTFEAKTDVPRPFRVYWQVVNTGGDAQRSNGLRGGFDEESVLERGKLTRRESTLYSGSHSIECFIVKDGVCVARSGLFFVNIS